ncbi:MAG: metallophosphoesterase [Archaeoglobaceae archaeon]
MLIALFSDVHGKILRCFKLVERWEKENDKKIDLILQTGDLGIFPDSERLDSATKKHLAKDEEELGFYNDFYQKSRRTERVLKKLDCDLVFMRGNHEDHIFLDSLEVEYEDVIFPVDTYKRIFCLKSGMVYTFSKGSEKIRIVGIGRIGGETKKKQDMKSIQEYERHRIISLTEDFDLLLTHDSPKDIVTIGFGAEEINLVFEKFNPIYHFYGHTGEDFNIRKIKETTLVKLSDLRWEKKGEYSVLKSNCMAILEWKDRKNHSLDVVHTYWSKKY